MSQTPDEADVKLVRDALAFYRGREDVGTLRKYGITKAQEAIPAFERILSRTKPSTNEEIKAAYERLHKEQVERSPFKSVHRTQDGK